MVRSFHIPISETLTAAERSGVYGATISPVWPILSATNAESRLRPSRQPNFSARWTRWSFRSTRARSSVRMWNIQSVCWIFKHARVNMQGMRRGSELEKRGTLTSAPTAPPVLMWNRYRRAACDTLGIGRSPKHSTWVCQLRLVTISSHV